MLIYAVNALIKQYPHFDIGVQTSCSELWQGIGINTSINETTPDVKIINAQYNTVNRSNDYPHHFIQGYLDFLSEELDVKIQYEPWHGFLPVSEKEMAYSYVEKITGEHKPYWIINAGYKLDYTAKQWDFDKYQKIVDSLPNVFFVQIGHNDHIHPNLTGDNVINLVGKTTLRQVIGLVYHSFGVLTGVSFPMLLSYAINSNPLFRRPTRACVVVAGGREPNHWQAPPNSQFLHTCGQLKCCLKGGCWKSRVVPLGEDSPWGKEDDKDESLCSYPVVLKSGQIIPKCMDMITAEEVIVAISRYMDNYV